MKRYRVIKHDFDARATWLTMEIKDEWEEHIKRMWRDGQEGIKQGLILEYGLDDAESKLRNFIDLGPKPFSVIAYHNRFAEQARRSFVVGGYYPVLTGTCALGERILNHLLLGLRDEFKGTPQYKDVYRKKSFDNWDLAIDTLEAWKVLVPDAAKAFRGLKDIRNRRAIHFDPATDSDDRDLALVAVRSLNEVISVQFGVSGSEPWFIKGVRGGECYVKKELESDPFVRLVYLTNSYLVGPCHRLEPAGEFGKDGWKIIEESSYEDREISDEQFGQLREQAVNKQLALPE